MKVSLTSTTKIVHLNGVPARVWEGKTETGIKVHAFITRIAIDKDSTGDQVLQFEEELKSCEAPSLDIAAYPLHLIL